MNVKLMFILSTNLNLIQMYAFLTNYLLSKTMDIVIFLYVKFTFFALLYFLV